MELGLLPSTIIESVQLIFNYFELLEAKNQAEKELIQTIKTGIIFSLLCY